MKILLAKGFKLPLLVWFAATLLVPSLVSAAAPRLTKEEVKPLLEKQEVIVVDDRSGRDWTSSEYKIKGAIRVVPGGEETWAAQYPKDKMIVFYCA